MSAIDTLRAALYGDPPVSGFQPSRAGTLQAFTELYNSLSTLGLGGTVSVTYATRAALDADLAHAADTLALVYDDATDTNNDFYLKVGASGAGSWTLLTILHDIIDNLAAPYVTNATTEATAAAASATAAAASAASVAQTIVNVLPGALIDSAFGKVDEQGRPIPGGTVPATGLVDVRHMSAPLGDAYITGTTPNRQVKLFRDAGVTDLVISPVGHDPDMVFQHGETISYRRTLADGFGTTGRRMIFSANKPRLRIGTTRLSMTPVYGQSNSNGGNLLTWAVSKKPVRRGRALMFGRAARLNYSTSFRLPFDDRAGLRDLFEANDTRQIGLGETPCSGFSYAHLGLVATTETSICNSYGIGSQSINALKKGTLPYQNLIDAVQQAQIMALAAGLTRVVVPRLFWVQGEADNGMSLATYQALLDTLQSDFTTDVQAITGQSEQVIFYVAQVSSSPNPTSAGPILAATALHVAYPTRFRCTGPMYRYPFVDTAHLTGLGTRQHGEDAGRKCGRIETAAATETCLYATSAVLSGLTLTVTFAGAEGNLALDTTEVTDPGQYGFTLTQSSGTPPTLSGFAVAGTNTMTCTLSGAPGTSPKLNIAMAPAGAGVNPGPTSGPRCCLRDTVSGTRSDSTTRHNYAAHQIIAVT